MLLNSAFPVSVVFAQEVNRTTKTLLQGDDWAYIQYRTWCTLRESTDLFERSRSGA